MIFGKSNGTYKTIQSTTEVAFAQIQYNQSETGLNFTQIIH